MVSRYILNGHNAEPCEDLLTWAQWFETADRKVADDYAGDWHERPVNISTVFLGVDHNFGSEGPPVLFETMIFGGKLAGEQWRYGTWEEAEKGHAHAVEQAKAALAEPA